MALFDLGESVPLGELALLGVGEVGQFGPAEGVARQPALDKACGEEVLGADAHEGLEDGKHVALGGRAVAPVGVRVVRARGILWEEGDEDADQGFERLDG